MIILVTVSSTNNQNLVFSKSYIYYTSCRPVKHTWTISIRFCNTLWTRYSEILLFVCFFFFFYFFYFYSHKCSYKYSVTKWPNLQRDLDFLNYMVEQVEECMHWRSKFRTSDMSRHNNSPVTNFCFRENAPLLIIPSLSCWHLLGMAP